MKNIIKVMIIIGVIGGILVIRSKPKNSLLYMVLSLINGSIMIIILGMNYIGLTLIIIYAVAISILIIFIIMMLEINNKENIQSIVSMAYIGIIIIIISINKSKEIRRENIIIWEEIINNNKMINSIGYIIYTSAMSNIIIISIILLMVMISVIEILKD